SRRAFCFAELHLPLRGRSKREIEPGSARAPLGESGGSVHAKSQRADPKTVASRAKKRCVIPLPFEGSCAVGHSDNVGTFEKHLEKFISLLKARLTAGHR